MQRRPNAWVSFGTAVLIGVLAAGCSAGTDSGAEEPTQPATSATSDAATDEPSPEASETAAGGVDPSDVEAWCKVVTPKQLTAWAGLKVERVMPSTSGMTRCAALVPGAEIALSWVSEPTSKSLDQYLTEFEKPTGMYEPRMVTLEGGQKAVLAPMAGSPRVTVGVVDGGRLLEATAGAVGDPDIGRRTLTEITEHVVSAYLN